MKKLLFLALVAISMSFVSCDKKSNSKDADKSDSETTEEISPKALKAWEKVKELYVPVSTIENVDEFNSVEEYNDAVQAFNAAVQEMVKYEDEYPEEIADSLVIMSNQFAETQKQVIEMIDQLSDAYEEGIEELDEE